MKFEIPAEIEKELQEKGGWNIIKKALPLDEINKVEKVLKVLSCNTRLKILYAISEQRMCVCMLTELTKSSYSKCSYHISKLKEAGLIKAEKKGRYIIYATTPFGRSIVRHFKKYRPEVKK